MGTTRSASTSRAILLALFVALAGCVAAPGMDPVAIDDLSENPEEVLQSLDDRHAEIDSVYGIVTTERSVGDTEETTTVERWSNPNEVAYASVLESSNSDQIGTVMVFDGETSWTTSDAGTAVQAVDGNLVASELPVGDAKGISSLRSDYEVTYVGPEWIAGTKTHHFEFTPTSAVGNDVVSYDSLEVWLDDDYWYPVKQHAEATVANQSVSMTITYEEISINGEIDSIDEFEDVNSLGTIDDLGESTVQDVDDLDDIEDVDETDEGIVHDVDHHDHFDNYRAIDGSIVERSTVAPL